MTCSSDQAEPLPRFGSPVSLFGPSEPASTGCEGQAGSQLMSVEKLAAVRSAGDAGPDRWCIHTVDGDLQSPRIEGHETEAGPGIHLRDDQLPAQPEAWREVR